MILRLTNGLTKAEWEYEVEDGRSSSLYYDVELRIDPAMPEGEYAYELINGGDTVARGVLQVGDYRPERTEYSMNKQNTYIVYNG